MINPPAFTQNYLQARNILVTPQQSNFEAQTNLPPKLFRLAAYLLRQIAVFHLATRETHTRK
jgi:hypothetical protein